jgi:hypothetical protein
MAPLFYTGSVFIRRSRHPWQASYACFVADCGLICSLISLRFYYWSINALCLIARLPGRRCPMWRLHDRRWPCIPFVLPGRGISPPFITIDFCIYFMHHRLQQIIGSVVAALMNC